MWSPRTLATINPECVSALTSTQKTYCCVCNVMGNIGLGLIHSINDEADIFVKMAFSLFSMFVINSLFSSPNKKKLLLFNWKVKRDLPISWSLTAILFLPSAREWEYCTRDCGACANIRLQSFQAFRKEWENWGGVMNIKQLDWGWAYNSLTPWLMARIEFQSNFNL